MKRYADDYETVITTDENGNEKKVAVYHGNYFEISLDEKGLSNFRRNCLMLLPVIAVLHFSGGFVGNRGMYQFYVALPFVFAFLPMVYLAMGVLRLPLDKRKYRRDEVGLSFELMKTTSIILLIIIAAGILGEIAFLLFSVMADNSLLEYLYLALEVLAASAVYLFIKLQRHIHIKTSSED